MRGSEPRGRVAAGRVKSVITTVYVYLHAHYHCYPISLGYLVYLKPTARMYLHALWPVESVHRLEGRTISSVAALPAWIGAGDVLETDIQPGTGRVEEVLMVKYQFEGKRIETREIARVRLGRVYLLDATHLEDNGPSRWRWRRRWG